MCRSKTSAEFDRILVNWGWGVDLNPNLLVHITELVGPVGFVPTNIVGTISKLTLSLPISRQEESLGAESL
jgi:hypothetical protein